MASPPNNDSGTDFSMNRSFNWWRIARPVNLKTVDNRVEDGLQRTALHGRRCLITCETSPPSSIQAYNLVPETTKSTELRKLQYAWGRRFSPNNRWNILYLRSDIHHGFDDGTWALVPDRALVTSIRSKITAEKKRRRAEKITGAWPDFRSSDWFPSKTNPPYRYHLVTLQDYEYPPVITRRGLPEEDAPSATPHFAPYSDFPVLESHIHPYMVIMNAFPKLVGSRRQIPDEVGAMLGDLLFIYNTWRAAYLDAGEQTSESGTGSESPVGTRSDEEMEVAYPTSRPGMHDEESESTDSRKDGLSVLSHSKDSVMDQAPILDPPVSTRALDEHDDSNQTLSISDRIAEWVQRVEAARTHGGLEDIADETELNTVEETCRTPVEDWHAWRSDFAPWYVLMPKNRALLSSNDWVEVENYPPLTRALEDETS